VDGKEIPPGPRSRGEGRRGARDHGAERLGKSTLAHVLAGRDGYEVTEGSVRLDGHDLVGLSPEERAHRGVFLAMQYPVELPGVKQQRCSCAPR